MLSKSVDDVGGDTEELCDYEEQAAPDFSGERLEVFSQRDGVCGDVFSWWWHQVEQFPLLTPQREALLAARVRQGDESAFEEMVESNLRLVVAIARRCLPYAGPSLALTDLVQEGAIGLIRAVHKFDHRRGYKFSTYATYWIRQAVMRSINDTGRSIRLPIHVTEKIHKAEKARLTLTQSLERAPSTPELADYLDVPSERLAQLFDRAVEPYSLEATINESQDQWTLEECLADSDAPVPDDLVLDDIARANVCQTLRRALDDLPQREADVITLRYGLDGGPGLTLSEVAGRFKLSRERVRQIESSAIRHLRKCETLREVVEES